MDTVSLTCPERRSGDHPWTRERLLIWDYGDCCREYLDLLFYPRMGLRSSEILERRILVGGRPAPDLLDGVDAVVHLAGAPIFGRFTAVHKAAVRDSRVGPTRRLAEVAASCGVKVFDLRIACTMMEAWLMADPRGFSDFFHFRVGKIPQDPDSLDRAKQSLLSLVKRFGKGADPR